MNINEFVTLALQEDLNGLLDYSTVACIPEGTQGEAILKIKEDGVLSGMQAAYDILEAYGKPFRMDNFLHDGDSITNGQIAFCLNADVHTILLLERLILNLMQRMSGIATLTRDYVKLVEGYPVKILDTRKTTPLLRQFEKKAVRDGGGYNHRMGLYDMIMLKDNHIDFCGSITKAVNKTKAYLRENDLEIPIEVETRNLSEVTETLNVGGVSRIMLDNFMPQKIKEAVSLIDGQCETEASGGINKSTIIEYADTGVDYISLGAITHHAVNLDLSLKAKSL